MSEETHVLYNKIYFIGKKQDRYGATSPSYYDNVWIKDAKIEPNVGGVEIHISPTRSIVVAHNRFLDKILAGLGIEDSHIKTEFCVGIWAAQFDIIPKNSIFHDRSVKDNGKEGGFEYVYGQPAFDAKTLKPGDTVVVPGYYPSIFLGYFDKYLEIYFSGASASYSEVNNRRSYWLMLAKLNGLNMDWGVTNNIHKVVRGTVSPREATGLAFMKATYPIPIIGQYKIEEKEFKVPKYLVEDGVSNNFQSIALSGTNVMTGFSRAGYSSRVIVEGSVIKTVVISSNGLTRPLCK